MEGAGSNALHELSQILSATSAQSADTVTPPLTEVALYGEFEHFIRTHIPQASSPDNLEKVGLGPVHELGSGEQTSRDIGGLIHQPTTGSNPEQSTSSSVVAPYQHVVPHIRTAQAPPRLLPQGHMASLVASDPSIPMSGVRPLSETERLFGLTQVTQHLLNDFRRNEDVHLLESHLIMNNDINPNLQEFRELLRMNLFNPVKTYYKVSDSLLLTRLSSRNSFFDRMVRPVMSGPLDRYMQAWKIQRIGSFAVVHYLGVLGAKTRKQTNSILSHLPAYSALDRGEWPDQTHYFVIEAEDLYRHPIARNS